MDKATGLASLAVAAALLKGIGKVLCGVGKVLSALKGGGGEPKRKPKRFNVRATMVFGQIALAISAISSGSTSFVPPFESLSPVPSAVLTDAAWVSLAADDCPEAIRQATACTDAFKGMADQAQRAFEREGMPPDAMARFARPDADLSGSDGVLDDVATCHFLVGRTYERMGGHLTEARGAYRRAVRYTFARTRDPDGRCWSPSQAASACLATMGA